MQIGMNPTMPPEEASRDWDARRNAAVEALIASGRGALSRSDAAGLSRDDVDDKAIRLVFFQLRREDRAKFQGGASDDAYLYEAIIRCMQNARDDERRRFSRAVSKLLTAFLGEDLYSVLYDLADEHEIQLA